MTISKAGMTLPHAAQYPVVPNNLQILTTWTRKSSNKIALFITSWKIADIELVGLSGEKESIRLNGAKNRQPSGSGFDKLDRADSMNLVPLSKNPWRHFLPLNRLYKRGESAAREKVAEGRTCKERRLYLMMALKIWMNVVARQTTNTLIGYIVRTIRTWWMVLFGRFHSSPFTVLYVDQPWESTVQVNSIQWLFD